jgi:hypothetical protein
MLVVKIDIWPYGDLRKAKGLHKINIINDGTGTEEIGNYLAEIERDGKRKIMRFTGFHRSCGHLTNDGDLRLLYLVLKKHFEGNQDA